MDQRYAERRAEIDRLFAAAMPDPTATKTFLSPSGRFRLNVYEYELGEGLWSYSRGIVLSAADDTTIADIRRNYSLFWHAWVEHANGDEYLLCGEDYQGQTVVNLTRRLTHTYFPEEAYNGGGFCWAAAYPGTRTRPSA